MAANHFFQAIRETVRQAFLQLGVSVDANADPDDVSVRADGLVEFNLRWRVVGDDECGTVAHWSDRDDVVEFGAVERMDREAVNLLHVTIVFDDDIAQLNVMSERHTEFNFDATLSPPLEEPNRLSEVVELLHSIVATMQEAV